MARIYGVLCDGCGGADVISAEDSMNEDLLPRRNWVTITVWEGEGKHRDPGPEIHACSTACMKTVADKLDGKAPEEHTHTH